MKNININDIKSNLKNSGQEIIILSTDNDERFFEAKKMLEMEVPNIKYKLITKDFIINYKEKEKLFELYKEVRKEKENIDELRSNFNDPNIFVNLMLKAGLANGIVSGATHPTAKILKPAFQIIKARTNGSPISSLMWMKKQEKRDLFFADVSVVPQPTSEQLAQIAINSAETILKVFNIEPVIAMLSFSTNGSGGKHIDVLKVSEATKIIKEKTNFKIFGEIQFDAAINENVLKNKMNLKNIDKMPNIFIFPDLNSGNIGYKIAASLGEYEAIGPILQNINLPVNDLSRSCTSEEIVNLVIITAMQSLSL